MAQKSWFKFEKFENSANGATTVYIYDEISAYGVSAKDFIKELSSIKASSINLRINSPGGDVFDGITIHNALRQHSSKVHVQIDGLAASIASVIAMSGDEIRMAKNSFMMIHNAWALAAGNAADMRKLADTLDKIDGTLVKTYQDKTGASERDIKSMMADETWFTADEALAAGFCDAVGDPAEIKARFDLSKFNKVPQVVAAMNIISKPDNERDLEAVLRDSGMSRKEALVAVATLKIEAQRDSEVSELQKLKEFMQSALMKTVLTTK